MGVSQWLEAHEAELRNIMLELFAHPETAGEEYFAAECLSEFLANQGFSIERGIGGLETAFSASWGSEGPVIGFLAEYDALPALGQQAVPYRKRQEGNGHGCGHNLLGTGIVAAGCALKAELEALGIPGRIVIYGCPEEEICRGKIVMAEAGCFDGLDCAVSWHPSDKNQVSEEVFQAMVSRKFRFYGKSSHAAASPEQGRSALDAAEIMNVAVNYLREHVPSTVRMHYVYTSAGEKPNIVPDYAELWYYVRAENTAVMRDAERRVILAAQGAALATETSMETEEQIASPETRINYTLAYEMEKILKADGGPEFTDTELDFAEELHKNLGIEGNVIHDGIYPLKGELCYMTGSTDVSAVSQIVPEVTLNTVCYPAGIPGHHWGITACSGSDFGFRGMMAAARIMAHFGVKICRTPELIAEAKKELGTVI